MSVEYEISKGVDLSCILESQNSLNLANMASNQTFFLANRDAIDRNNIITLDSITKSSSDIILSINTGNTAALITIEKVRGDIICNSNTIGSDIEKLIFTSLTSVQAENSKRDIETRSILSANNTNLLSNIKDSETIVCNVIAVQSMESTKQVGNLELCLNNVKTHLELQIAQVSANIQVESLKSIQVLTAQMLQCCCELKEMLTLTTNTTQQLIRELDNTRIKDNLNTVNMEILMKKFKD